MVEPWEMNSMFSAAFMSSPKWIVCSWRAWLYTLYMASPPGKELWLLARVADCTSQGNSLDVIDLEREATNRA